MMRKPKLITCSACGGENRPHAARGWCKTCYRRWIAHGKPESGPPPRRPAPKCGTRQGWDRHVYRGEKACGPCRKAHADDVREWSHTSPRLMRASEPCTGWDDQQASAARMTAELAADADDCRYLLDALGLLPEGVRRPEQIGGAA